MKLIGYCAVTLLTIVLTLFYLVNKTPEDKQKRTPIDGYAANFGSLLNVSHDGHLFVVYGNKSFIHHPQCTNSFCK